MNEELMTNDEIEVVGEPEEVMDERSGMPTGLAMLIGDFEVAEEEEFEIIEEEE